MAGVEQDCGLYFCQELLKRFKFSVLTNIIHVNDVVRILETHLAGFSNCDLRLSFFVYSG